jgi:hypothetical protein
VIEQDAVAGIDTVGLAIVHGNPVGVDFRAGIGAARVEGGECGWLQEWRS